MDRANVIRIVSAADEARRLHLLIFDQPRRERARIFHEAEAV
jgi:hypothetical protein